MISDEDRRLLFTQCAGHAVCYCAQCHTWWQPRELALDLFRDRRPVCRQCRADLTQNVQQHLTMCESVRRSRELIKQSRERRDSAEVHIAESEERLQRTAADLCQPEPPSVVAGVAEALLSVADGGQCAPCLAAKTGIGVVQIEALIERISHQLKITVRDDVCARCSTLQRVFSLSRTA